MSEQCSRQRPSAVALTLRHRRRSSDRPSMTVTSDLLVVI